MYLQTGTDPQLFAVVGSAYVSERHNEEAHQYLPLSDDGSLFDFNELLTKLRRALSCCGRGER